MNYPLRLLLILFVSLFLIPSETVARHFNYRHLDMEDGLPTDRVFCVHKDRKGYLWFGTDEGLCRFNGREIKVFNTGDGLPDNSILGLFEDSRGWLWVYTYNGKPGFLRNDSIFTAENSPILKGVEGPYFTTVIQEDQHGGIFYNCGNIFYLQAHSPPILLEQLDEDVKDLSVFQEQGPGQFRFLGREATFSRSFGTGLQIVSANPEKMPRFGTKKLALGDGNFLVTNGKSIYLWDGNSLSPFPASLPDRIISLQKTSRGNIWFGTISGAWRYDKKDQSLHRFLAEYPVSGIEEDETGNLWFSTLGSGIFVSPMPPVYSWGKAEGIGAIYALCRDEKGTVIAGGEGNQLYFRKGSEFRIVDVPGSSDTPGEMRIGRLISTPEGAVWGGGDVSLFSIRDGHLQAFPLMAIKDLEVDPKGQVWQSTTLGVGQLNKGVREILSGMPFEQWRETSESAQAFIQQLRIEGRTNAIAFGRDGTLFQARTSGLSMLPPGAKKSTPIPGLENIVITDLLFNESGRLYGATSGWGIFYLEGGKIYWIREQEGFPGGSAHRLFYENADRLWAATSRGLVLIQTGSDSIACQAFGENEGLISRNIWDVLVSGDTVWVATSAGLLALPKASLLEPKSPPLLEWKGLQVAGKMRRVPDSLVLNADENRLKFSFEAIHFNTARKIRYRYRLKGLEQEWNHTFSQEISYNSLPPGNYQFVLACQAGSGPFSEELTLPVFLARPWWKLPWVWVLGGLVYAGLVWLAFSLRLRAVKKRESLERKVLVSEQKALRAQMNPHFLFNALNSVQMFFLRKQAREGNIFLKKFSTLIRKILENSDQLYLSIEEELEMIRPYMEFEELRCDHKFKFEIEIDPKIDPWNTLIPGFLLQPLLENAIWHGVMPATGPGLIQLQIRAEKAGLTLVVRDNGVGRAEAKKVADRRRKSHKSMGLKLIQDRIEVVNALGNRNLRFQLIDLQDAQGEAAGTEAKILLSNYPNGTN